MEWSEWSDSQYSSPLRRKYSTAEPVHLHGTEHKRNTGRDHRPFNYQDATRRPERMDRHLPQRRRIPHVSGPSYPMGVHPGLNPGQLTFTHRRTRRILRRAISTTEGYTEISERIPFYVGPAYRELSIGKERVIEEGEGIEVTYSRTHPASTNDWIGIYKTGRSSRHGRHIPTHGTTSGGQHSGGTLTLA